MQQIIETRAAITVDKKSTIVDAICLEGLIVTKHRANRDQDLEDLSLIAMYCFRNTDWKILNKFTKNDLEFRQIATDMKFYKDNPQFEKKLEFLLNNLYLFETFLGAL